MKRFVSLLVLVLLAMTTVIALQNNVAAPIAWQPGTVVSEQDIQRHGVGHYFGIDSISDGVMDRMKQGGSYPSGCRVPRSDLRYLRLLHVDYEGRTVCGEMVCNRLIAQDLVEIFRELYRQRYPIERMVLIDNYGADDETSMRHNNTSAFCYRTVNGSKTLSRHAMGMAVDVNTLHNPCVRLDAHGRITKLQPNTPEAREYAKRTPKRAHMIDRKDLCYRLFVQHGFRWGGAWRTVKDYQHFEK